MFVGTLVTALLAALPVSIAKRFPNPRLRNDSADKAAQDYLLDLFVPHRRHLKQFIVTCPLTKFLPNSDFCASGYGGFHMLCTAHNYTEAAAKCAANGLRLADITDANNLAAQQTLANCLSPSGLSIRLGGLLQWALCESVFGSEWTGCRFRER
jgi:hypothetical protein